MNMPRNSTPPAHVAATISNPGPPRTVAVIDIGTTSIRLAIAEITAEGDVRPLEALSQAVNLGKDTFTRGGIRKSTIEECVKVLKSYHRVLAEYQITSPDQMRVVATSAVREADNRLAFIDRIYIATGIEVEPIDDAEENRITYLGVQPFLETATELADATTVILEVGGGSTELLVVQAGNVIYSHSYRLGSLRLRQTLETYRAPQGKVRSIMENRIRHTVQQIIGHVPREGATEIIALGGDIRFAASRLVDDWNPETLTRLPVSELERFTEEILALTPDEIVNRYHVTFPDAEMLGPALLTYLELAHGFEAERLLTTNVNLRDGLLQSMAAHAAWTEEFSNQIIRSAVDLGRRFHFDETHCRHIADLSRQLFRELAGEHQLESRYELLLYIAALLHDIGLYIGTGGYHKHSMYLITNSDLFGLSKKDVLLTGLIARYHRRASPRPSHQGYAALPRDDRVTVSKLAAILRLAIALDESRSQRIQSVTCSRDKGRLIITTPDVDDLSLEQLALKQSGSMFEEIFGLQVLLRSTGP